MFNFEIMIQFNLDLIWSEVIIYDEIIDYIATEKRRKELLMLGSLQLNHIKHFHPTTGIYSYLVEYR